MALPRPSTPRAAWADLKAFLGQGGRHKLLIAIVSIMMPIIIIIGFVMDGKTNILPGKQVVYIQSWPANRTDAEIIAQQKIDQKKREAEQEARRQSYQRLADQLGIE